MRRFSFLFLVACMLMPMCGWAAHNPADYPLRVHIFGHNGVSHYSGFRGTNSLEDVDGEGRANLYENSQPRGFDFHYSCEERLMNSMGFETYPARWKKINAELEVLFPLSGKTCKFHVAMKDGVIYRHSQGSIVEGPADKFKAWMDKYQYDPEHGKNLPVKPAELVASGINAAEFPLRVHIFVHTGVSHYAAPAQSTLNVVEGEGRANLYEDGQPHGFDFSYHCSARLMDSLGYDTYQARWKTRDRVLEVVQPATDKVCEVNTALKSGVAYTSENGTIEQKSAAEFKQWMDRVQYDPEHGKNLPVAPAAEKAPTSATASEH